jgi:hypothetical protein
MRNRERGASQLPLVICIVLLLIAAVFAFMQYSDKETLTARLTTIQTAAKEEGVAGLPSDRQIIDLIDFAQGPARDAKARLEEVVVETGGGEEEILDLVISPTKLKNTRNKFLDASSAGEFVVEFPIEVYKASDDGGVGVQQGNKMVVSYFLNKDLRQSKPDMTNILEYMVIPGARRMIADIKRYRDLAQQATTMKLTAEEGYRKDLTAKDAEIRAKIDENAALDARKAQDISDLRNQVQTAEAAKTAAEEEKAKAIAELTAERNALRSQNEQLSGQVQVLKAKKRAIEEDTSPDGEVLSIGENQTFAVINLGRANNNLLPGTNFDIYAIGKGGMEIPKGVLKVKKVDDETAECAILQVFDRFNPIAQGDQIRSMTYSPKETVHVALVGRFQKMGKSDAAARLKQLGVVVDDKVTIHTTYLVVGAPESESQPIEDTPEYKAAELYGIQKLTERELSRFTMY